METCLDLSITDETSIIIGAVLHDFRLLLQPLLLQQMDVPLRAQPIREFVISCVLACLMGVCLQASSARAWLTHVVLEA